jgi:hypothetical protein
MTIYSPSPITHVDALEQKLNIKYEENKNIAQISFAENLKSQSGIDVLLYYRHEKIHIPTAILGKSHVESSVIHGCLAFIPEINPRSTEASWKSVFEIDYKME